MPRVFAALSALVMFAVATAAEASPSSRLTYVRGPGAERCPDEAELRRAVADRLGYDPFFPWAKTTIVAQIARKAGGYAGELKLLDENGVSLGERVLPTTSQDCGEVVRSLALAISIAIDDLEQQAAAPQQAEPEPPRAPPAETKVEPPPPAAAAEQPAPTATPAPARAPLWLAAEISGLASVSSAPAPAFVGAAGARLGGSWWSLGLDFRGQLPSSDSIRGGGRVEATLVLGLLSACLKTGETWRPFVCAVGALGSYRGTTTDVSAPRGESAVYAAMGGRIGTELAISPALYALGYVGALGTFTPHRTLLNGEVVFSLPTVSQEIGIGLGLRIL